VCSSDLMREGPAEALVTIINGKVAQLSITVGGSTPAQIVDLQLGEVNALAAARYLIHIAPVTTGEVAEEALLGAVIARKAEVAESLLDIVKNDIHSDDLRSSALSWLAVFAAEKAMSPIQHLIAADSEAMDLREHAVFALSQIESPKTIDSLISIARDTQNPRLQQAAIFALIQHDSPKVMELYEEILLGE